MMRPSLPFSDLQGALVQGLRFFIRTLLPAEPSQTMEGKSDKRVLRTQRLFKDPQGVQPLTVVDNSSPFLLLAWLPFSI